MSRHLSLVVNPEARGGPGAALEQARALARAHGWSVDEQVAEIRGHAYLLTQEAVAAGVDLVVAVGGDGTVREVAAGLAGTPVPLAIAAAGSGNSSYLELFGETPWEETLGGVLDHREERAVDLIELERTGEVGLLGFSGGWFAQIVRLAAGVTSTGAARYAEAAGIAAVTPASFPATVRADGQTVFNGDIGLVAIGGARVRAAVFPVFPVARMDDGLLDLLVVEATDTAGFNELLGAVLEGTHLEHPLAHHAQARRVDLVAPSGFEAELDGDLSEHDFYEVSAVCAPGRLRVAIPA